MLLLSLLLKKQFYVNPWICSRLNLLQRAIANSLDAQSVFLLLTNRLLHFEKLHFRIHGYCERKQGNVGKFMGGWCNNIFLWPFLEEVEPLNSGTIFNLAEVNSVKLNLIFFAGVSNELGLRELVNAIDFGDTLKSQQLRR